MSLWVVRHARPLLASGVCYGALDVNADADLTLAAAQTLAQTLPPALAVQVSPLQRCQQLADALQTLRPDLGFATDARLREMDFGVWEGVPWSDIPRAAVDAWTAEFSTHRFGGRESANEVLQRVALVWDELPAHRERVWIAHAGIAQAVSVLRQGTRHIVQAADWPLVSLPYGQWVKF